jgi:hypothetical protein
MIALSRDDPLPRNVRAWDSLEVPGPSRSTKRDSLRAAWLENDGGMAPKETKDVAGSAGYIRILIVRV